MTRSQQISLGLKTFGQATGFIFRNNLAWTFLIPVALNILLFIGGQALIIDLMTYIKGIFLDWINLDKNAFWGGIIGTLLSILTEILFFFVFAYIAGYIIIILMSPLLAYLSEKTEQILTGKKYNTSFSQLMKDVSRGIAIALRNLFLELFFMVIIFFVNFIPLIGWIGTIILFLISSYFYGFSFIDYINERQKMNIKDSVSVVRKYKWIAISNGAVFSIFLLIPFCGAFVSVFVAIVSVVAAAIAMHKTNAYSEEPD
jgi:CysZ protein